MNGVNILTQDVINGAHTGLLVGSFVFILVVAIVLGIYANPHDRKSFIVAFAALALFFIGLTLSVTIFAIPTNRNMYTAEIDETVSLTEFYDKYTDIEYKNGVWHFKDKEVESE